MKLDYPVCLRMEGKSCVVVGGGQVALRKITGLLECGAKIKVISPEIVPGIARLAGKGKIRVLRRAYRAGDLKGAFLAIGATNEVKVNQRISAEADRRGILVNIVDQPELCNITMPARIRRGPITIAISSGGASPALARRLREKLEETIGPEYGRLAVLLGRSRKQMKKASPSELEQLLNAGVLTLVMHGKMKQAEARIKECLSSLSD